MFMVACTPWSIEQLERVLQRLHHAPSERAEVNMDFRGPTRSTQVPKTAADGLGDAQQLGL
jgi:hypothetical protein